MMTTITWRAVLLACVIWASPGSADAEAALLDGVLTDFEQWLGKHLAKKGERLVLGNFYTTERPDEHGPMGTMGNHTHNKGEVMASYRYMQMHMAGNRTGATDVSSAAVLSQFPVSPLRMTTQMHMFSGMYGVNNTVTLMGMLPYVQKSMDLVTRSGTNFTTNSSGFGDLGLRSLWRLYALEAPSLGSHQSFLNFGVNLPTGDIKATDNTPAGTDMRLPYPMQLGSGTVDLVPGIVYLGRTPDISWGFQYIATIRLGTNSQGYSMGDSDLINAWGAYRWTDWLSTSVRLSWMNWDNYDGMDPHLNPKMVPTADPNLRGGDRLNILGGGNILLHQWLDVDHFLGFEAGAPIYQNLDGPQLKSDWVFWLAYQIVLE